MTSRKLPRQIMHWDDERSIGNSLIVSLAYGWRFDDGYSMHVKGFDTVKEATEATRQKYLKRCDCEECTEELAKEKPIKK